MQVTLDFNAATGLLTANFVSLDPKTGQAPAGALDGFLYPENGTGVGQGFVGYTVQPKSGLATGTTINQQAEVVFDTNAPLNTAVVVNTIDNGAPASTVTALPAQSSSPFTVSWTGQDDAGGSGVASYDIFVSDNGAAFTPFLTGTTATSATFTGQDGHTYGFYSVATDNVGHVQTTPTAAQASTTVTVAAALDALVVGADGSLMEFDPSGAAVALSPAGTILFAETSLGPNGTTVVYALTTGLEGAQYQNTLWEYTATTGWSEMSSGFFQQIAAATNSGGQPVVFGVIGQANAEYADSLWEQSSAFGHIGLDSGWRLLSAAGSIQSISAVTDGAGNDVVYAIVVSGNNLYEHSPAFAGDGWRQLSTGSFAQVSAGLNAAGDAVSYSVLTNGQLWEQNPAFGPAGVDMQFHQLSGMNGLPPLFTSVTAGGPDKAFGIASDGTIWEQSPAGAKQLSATFIATQLSATQTQQGVDEVFMTLIDGSFWEYSTAFPSASPFKELFPSGAASSSTPV